MKLKVPKPEGAEVTEDRIKSRVAEVKHEIPDLYDHVKDGGEDRHGQNLYSNPESYDTVRIKDQSLLDWLRNFRGVIGTDLGEAVGILVFIDSMAQLDLACRLQIADQ